ncbi:MAG TPA: hypothetical protein VMM55_05520 [Thermohalobaculum sp.]|nr:hypothetical protein [Thermohalobaculum sp.]
MTMHASILPAAALALALAAPAAAQEILDRDDAPALVEDDADLLLPQDPQAPALFGGEGYAAEDFSWMNPEGDRWPNDLDPRDDVYLPSPEPNVTFELDLSF